METIETEATAAGSAELPATAAGSATSLTETESLTLLKDDIEALPREQQVKVLQLLKHEGTVKINSNKSGVYINLTLLPEPSVRKLHEYLAYYREQERTLKIHEDAKLQIQHSFFSSSAAQYLLQK